MILYILFFSILNKQLASVICRTDWSRLIGVFPCDLLDEKESNAFTALFQTQYITFHPTKTSLRQLKKSAVGVCLNRFTPWCKIRMRCAFFFLCLSDSCGRGILHPVLYLLVEARRRFFFTSQQSDNNLFMSPFALFPRFFLGPFSSRFLPVSLMSAFPQSRSPPLSLSLKLSVCV